MAAIMGQGISMQSKPQVALAAAHLDLPVVVALLQRTTRQGSFGNHRKQHMGLDLRLLAVAACPGELRMKVHYTHCYVDQSDHLDDYERPGEKN